MTDVHHEAGYADDLESSMDEVEGPVVQMLQVSQVVLLEDEGGYPEAMANVVHELTECADFPVLHLPYNPQQLTRDRIFDHLCGANTLVVCGESEYVNPTTREGFRLIDRLSRQGFTDILVYQVSPPEVTKVYEDIRLKGIWRLLRASAPELFERNINDFRQALAQACRFVEPRETP